MKLVLNFILISLISWVNGQSTPNIIVVLVDDMGYSDLGSFGERYELQISTILPVMSPFTQNYNSARCCPSRASLLTGLYSHQAGIANFTGGDQSKRFRSCIFRKIE